MLSYKLGETKEIDFFNNKNDLALLAVTNDGTPVLVDGSTVDEPEIDYSDPKFKREIAYRAASNVNKTIPVGTMMMWLNKDTIPSGWHLCDGSKIDDLNISNSSKTKLKNVLDSDGYLPKLLYTEEDTQKSIYIGTLGEENKIIGRNGGEKLAGNIKITENGKLAYNKHKFDLKLEDLPFHSHGFRDYYVGDNKIAPGERHLDSGIVVFANQKFDQKNKRNDAYKYYSIDIQNRNYGGSKAWLDLYKDKNADAAYLWARNITDGMLRIGDNTFTNSDKTSGDPDDIFDNHVTRDGKYYTLNAGKEANLNSKSHTLEEWKERDNGINYLYVMPSKKFNVYYIIKVE